LAESLWSSRAEMRTLGSYALKGIRGFASLNPITNPLFSLPRQCSLAFGAPGPAQSVQHASWNLSLARQLCASTQLRNKSYRPRRSSPEDLAKQVNLRRLPKSMTEPDLRAILRSLPDLEGITPPWRIRVISAAFNPNSAAGYLHFGSPTDALRCQRALDGLQLPGTPAGLPITAKINSLAPKPIASTIHMARKIYVGGLGRGLIIPKFQEKYRAPLAAWVESSFGIRPGYIHEHRALKNGSKTRERLITKDGDMLCSGAVFLIMSSSEDAAAVLESYHRQYPEGAEFMGRTIRMARCNRPTPATIRQRGEED
jgi:RNA recognition motif-containing protein